MWQHGHLQIVRSLARLRGNLRLLGCFFCVCVFALSSKPQLETSFAAPLLRRRVDPAQREEDAQRSFLDLSSRTGRHHEKPATRLLASPMADFTSEACGWLTNLGTPAALVAGAAIASALELKDSCYVFHKSEDKLIRLKRKLTMLLLLSSFALEISAVFITTVTNTMLLGNASHMAIGSYHALNTFAYSATEMLHRELEFEYLASRLFFFQGLINWLAAIGVYLSIPLRDMPSDSPEGSAHDKSIRNLRISGSLSIAATVLFMMAFYNKHLVFHGNYLGMWYRFLVLLAKRFFFRWPPAFLALAAGGFAGASLQHAVRAFLYPLNCDRNVQASQGNR